jgi:AmiR/NasT family two-component response regulator
MAPGSLRQLRVLLADGRPEHLAHISSVVTRLGHSVIGTVTDVASVAVQTETEPADVAIVAFDESGNHALKLISTIVRESVCPVIVVLPVEDTTFVREAAKRGVFAYITDGEASDDQFESAIDVVLHRFGEYHDLQGAFGRRAITERAKGILMERHQIDEEAAFNLLRDEARSHSRKLIDVAQALLDAHRLLPRQRAEDQSGLPSGG